MFNDPAERRWLEQLVHPLVRQRRGAGPAPLRASGGADDSAAAGAGLDSLCHEVWLVDCDMHQQLGRLQQRDGLNAAEAKARIDAQWPLSRKRELADGGNRGSADALIELNRCVQRTPNHFVITHLLPACTGIAS